MTELPAEPGAVLDPQLGLDGEEEPLLKDDDKVDWPTEVNEDLEETDD